MFTCFIKLQIFTGLRIGESLALEWTDIDFEKGTLEVNKTLTPDAKGTQTPKTKASYRTIQLADDTVKMLEEWKKFQYHKYWNLSQMPPKAVFWHMWTDSYCTQRIICRTLQSFVESISVPYHGGAHVMRHTYATLHLANGTPYHVIQKNLGHADISMTMRVYAHTHEEELKEANNNVINLFSKVGT